MNIKPQTGRRDYAKSESMRRYSVGGIVGSAIHGAMSEEAAEELQWDLYGIKNPEDRKEIQEEHAAAESLAGGIVGGEAQKALHK